ncbi:MAG: cytochrome b [Rhodobacteraceae bacterium]|nr:cytochrome b [Paracoccaceae bacterium]
MTSQTETGMTGARDNYDRISRFNHWLVAVAIIGMLGFGFYLSWFVERGPEKGALIGIHKAVGVLILVYGVWRIGYRLFQGFKTEAARMPGWQVTAAKCVHWVLMACILVMPLSGIAGSYFAGRATEVFGLFTIPAGPEIEALNAVAGYAHDVTAWILVIAIVAHTAGAVKHHLIDRDTTLLRMLGRA